jgi:ATP-dependent DNA helicase DinG
LTKHDIYEIFDKGGLLEKHFSGYEYREGQLLMAELVRESYETGAIAAIEAGTGIGKSFAYLAVALYHAMSSPDERTVIATSTINLQKQLYEKDLPMLFRYLGFSCKTALAVGRATMCASTGSCRPAMRPACSARIRKASSIRSGSGCKARRPVCLPIILHA